MKRLALLVPACALAFAVIGCGPLTSPLPARLDPETQQEVDASWNRAFFKPDRLNRQELLDVMIGTQAYQLGVDSFHVRATKKIAGGSVVMEISFDRNLPDEDRFEVTLLDEAGQVLRYERFGRKDVDETHQILFVNMPPDDPAVAARRAEHEARWNKIREFFPAPKEEGQSGKKKG
jgi:hypothetical protein